MNKNIFIAPLIIVLFSFSLTILVFTPVSFKNIAQALTGNYSKSTGEQLTITDWNNLQNDFLDKSGDMMGGSLNMGGNRITSLASPTSGNDAVNRDFMTSEINNSITTTLGASIVNVSGNPIKMVCGKTGINNWQYPWNDRNIVRIDVDTSAAGFSSDNVLYLTSIGGVTQHFYTKGASSIYSPTRNGFTLYVVYEWNEPNFLTLQRASEWGWHINWCGITQ